MKGVSEIISIVLIIVIAIGLVSTAYTWGIPLIQKTQGRAAADQVAAAFDPSNSNSLTSQIYNVFSSGGQYEFTLGTSGLWALKADDGTMDSNYIQFSFFSKVSDVANDKGWLSAQGSCPPLTGTLGSDTFYVVCSRADSFSDGFNVTYRVYYRELDSVTDNTGQKISIVPVSGITSSTGNSIRISRGSITQTVVGGKTLTVTEIKILLE